MTQPDPKPRRKPETRRKPDEASVKIRSGPPDDGDGPDAALGRWAGELPLRARWQRPLPDPVLSAGLPVPAHIKAMAGRDSGPLPRR